MHPGFIVEYRKMHRAGWFDFERGMHCDICD